MLKRLSSHRRLSLLYKEIDASLSARPENGSAAVFRNPQATGPRPEPEAALPGLTAFRAESRQVEATDFPAGEASGLRISASVIATPILIDGLRPRKARVNARFRLRSAVTVAVSGVTAIP